MLLTSHSLIAPTERLTTPTRTQREDKLWDHISYSSSRRTTQGYVFLQDALTRRGSLADVVQLASREHTCHDTTSGKCYNCDTVAMYYLLGIEWVLKQQGDINQQDRPISCTPDLLELVWQMCQMVLAHTDPSFQVGDWYGPMKKQLWILAKQLKEETIGSDCYVVNSPTTTTPSSPLLNHNYNNYFQHHLVSSPPPSPMVFEHPQGDAEMVCDEQEMYRRAIRITIYHCRALVYQQNDEMEKAINYFRKCIAVRSPPTLEAQKLLGQSAMVALDRLLSQQQQQQNFHTPTAKSSRSSSISSGSGGSASSSSSTCGNCGVEKRTMPVCAKCRVKFYCSSKCLVAHKIAHEKECKGRVGLRNK
ncbi:hypothetical protein BDA99DRAFT_518554 [Phascolomyces articulosus]|uniref:MYND-type domain-containing protein n=1 Tax=Phascolomyces articulosus TaxID=60185 RepID=A0AAD5K420_9FUNG|nr:hypothetical protein BDA99DRAFT_518554 [Phascolomyces articulosus]